METIITSTIPTGIRSTLGGWQKGENEKERCYKATSNNTADLAGSQPTPGPTDQIFTEQQVERKGSRQAPALHSDATCDSGNSCTLGNAPRAVSWGTTGPRPKSSGCKPAHTIWKANCPWPEQCPEGAEEAGNAIGSFVHNNPGKLQGLSLFSKSCLSQAFARAGILLWVTQNPTPLSFKQMRTLRPVSLERMSLGQMKSIT